MSVEFDLVNIEKVLERWLQSSLERRFIEEYLIGKGSRLEDLHKLPKEEAKTLMIEACKYASLKLAEVESKAQFRESIRAPSSSR